MLTAVICYKQVLISGYIPFVFVNRVVAEVKRLGGGFGAKSFLNCWVSGICGMASYVTNRYKCNSYTVHAVLCHKLLCHIQV